MASAWSGKIQIGDKVARVFQRHELIGGESDQLLFGKVVEMKYVIQKGSKKWTQKTVKTTTSKDGFLMGGLGGLSTPRQAPIRTHTLKTISKEEPTTKKRNNDTT